MVSSFDVIAEPTRRRILDRLRAGPCTVGDLATALELSQPNTSKHLKVLRDAELVRVRVDAQRRWYELNPEPLAHVDAWLAPYRWMWEGRIDALERHLDTLRDGADPRSMAERDDGHPKEDPT